LGSPETLKTVEEILIRETGENKGFRMLSNMVKGASFQGTKFEGLFGLMVESTLHSDSLSSKIDSDPRRLSPFLSLLHPTFPSFFQRFQCQF
jgi:hypothetical protein